MYKDVRPNFYILKGIIYKDVRHMTLTCLIGIIFLIFWPHVPVGTQMFVHQQKVEYKLL